MATQARMNMTRFHDLDALRGFAMLLGILLHAGVFLVPVEYWPVHEAWAWETAPEANVYAWILSVIHGFHLPLVIAAQMLVVTWPINIHLKFLLISTTIVAGLLVVYHVGVRYTVIGTVMNGPRTRRAAPAAESMVPRPEAGG